MSRDRIVHTLAGFQAPHTLTAPQVLGDMEACVTLWHRDRRPVPAIVPLITAARLRYCYEEPGRDDYTRIYEAPQIPLTWWLEHLEYAWQKWLELSPAERKARLAAAGDLVVWVYDCEDFACHLVAWVRQAGGRAFPICQQWEDAHTHRPRGWHAMAAWELPIGTNHIAEVPWPEVGGDSTWFGMLPQARPGYVWKLIDLAWFAGMPRRDQGRFPLSLPASIRVDGSHQPLTPYLRIAA